MQTQLGSKLLDQGRIGVQELAANANEIEFELDLIPHVLKIFNIQVIDSASLRKKNVVLISKEDFQEFFGADSTSETKTPRYFQIADKIYRVMFAGLQKGCIGITNSQKDTLDTAISSDQMISTLTAQPFDASKALKHALKTAEFSVSQYKVYSNGNEKIVVSADEIRSMIKEQLKAEFLQPNLPFFLQFPWGEMKAGVWKMNPPYASLGDKISYGEIANDTNIKLQPLFSSQVTIVDEIHEDDISHFEFKVELVQRLSSANRNYFPLVISSEEIKSHISDILTGRVICKGYDLTIPHPSGWDIRVKLNRAALEQNQLMTKKQKLVDEDLSEGYVVKKSSNICLIAKESEVALTQGIPIVPAEITFQIADIPGEATHSTINLDRERWVDVNELLEKLQQRSKPFALNETFEVHLTSGTYCILVSKVSSVNRKSIEQKESYLQSFALPSPNSIRFEAEPELEVSLIKNKNAIPLNKATFQVKALDSPDEEFLISAAELEKLIILQGPKQFVHKQSFELRTEGDQRLELKLVEVDFGGVQFDKHMSSFATLKKETEISFSSSVLEKVKVVHKVYQNEIEKLKFSLKPVRRKEVESYARVPLVLDLEETLAKIRKEIDIYKYILEGYSFKIPYGDGWDIEVKFSTGILKAEHRLGSQENRYLNVTSKKGYSTTNEMPIEFPPHMDDIILAREKPIVADSMHFKVVVVAESHTQDPDTIVKGNWINLEELKTYLIKSNKFFSKQEKFVVELETGRFVLEVANAKGSQKGKEEGGTKKPPGQMKFAIADSTTVGLTIENRFSLQKVKSGIPTPLKKIEFIVFPEQAGSDQISLKETEILKAIRETLTFPIVKKHLFSITTDSCHRLRVEVKGMHPAESCKTSKDELLGELGPDTEIVLKGKENTTLSINSPPKILEAKNPIAYLEEIGIGGIDKQFKQILRIFYTRSEKLSEEVARRGIKPTKGILLYGPPGTGKTTLARKIGDMMGCSGERINMINGTEMFNMWFGKSEELIRELFKPAKDAQDKYGEKSELYVIIIDEIDALLLQRGNSPSKTKDGLVTQFLGCMDGLEQLNNILIVGLTNRKEDIDSAALRPGRFGVHIEIGLPDLKGRETIFAIHMKKLHEEGLLFTVDSEELANMKEKEEHLETTVKELREKTVDNKELLEKTVKELASLKKLHKSILDKIVDLKELAKMTDKFSGADIEGLVAEATQFSVERLNETGLPKEELRDHPAGKITMKDFKTALSQRPKNSNVLPEGVRLMYGA